MVKLGKAIMVTAHVMATLSYYAMVMSPVGRVCLQWQKEEACKNFFHSNMVTLFSSLSAIQLLNSGLPVKCRLFMWILRVIVLIMFISFLVNQSTAIMVVTPHTPQLQSFRHSLQISTALCCVVAWILAV